MKSAVLMFAAMCLVAGPAAAQPVFRPVEPAIPPPPPPNPQPPTTTKPDEPKEKKPVVKKTGKDEKEINGLPLFFHEDFEDGKADGWEPTDRSAWNVRKDGDNYVYNLFKRRSNYKPKVRSPYNISMRKGLKVGDFVLDLQFRSTVKDYNHRDLCLFFGHQDASHFYYVHFGKKADPHANQIFIVNGKPRTKISITTTKGTNWDDQWHHARVVRKIDDGTIEVYFDNMTKPVMTAKDATFKEGGIGIGSFDDTGWFDDIKIYAKKK